MYSHYNILPPLVRMVHTVFNLYIANNNKYIVPNNEHEFRV